MDDSRASDAVSLHTIMPPASAAAADQTIVSVMFDNTDSAVLPDREAQHKNDLCFAWTRLLSMLYGITVILVGVAFPITEALRHEWLTSQTVAVFNVFCDGIAIAFLLYLIICLWQEQKGNETCLPKLTRDNHIKDLIIHLKKEPIKQTVQPVLNTFDQSGVINTGFTQEKLNFGSSSQNEETETQLVKSFTWHRSQSHEFVQTRLRRSVSAEANLCDYRNDGSEQSYNGYFNIPTGPATFWNDINPPWRGHRPQMSMSSMASTAPVLLPVTDDVYEKVMILRQTASLSHDGASFYLRLGALLFGIGNFVYVCVQIEFYLVEVTGKCDDYPVVYPMFLHLIFLIIQTFFIFKNTKVHVKRRKGLARFGFTHVLATNMCIWLRILVMEVMDGIDDSLEHDNRTEHNVESQFFEAHHENVTYCMHQDGLYLRSAPYLFPFVLEYSLIAVAVMAGMYHSLNIRLTQDILHAIRKAVKCDEKQVTKPASESVQSSVVEENFFAKSHRGLYLGAILMTGTILGVIMFFNFKSQHADNLAMEIYYLSDILLHAILIPPIIYAFHIFRHFKFTFNRDNTIDHTLLLVSLCGIVIYYIFILLTTASYLTFDEFDTIDDVITAMSMTAAVLNIIQSLVQGLFVIAGLQTCAITEEQQIKKPGRGIITFLIVGNISLWIFKTLQVKETGLNRFAEFYGITAWPIIVNTNLPLALFFRFHASVCLADMWTSAYKPEEGPKYKQLL